MRAVLALQSRRDASLALDAAEVWAAPAVVAERFRDAESTLLLTLRRVRGLWPPVQRLLDQSRPEEILLDADELDELLGPLADDLAAAGLDVLLPAELFAPLQLRAAVHQQSPAAVVGAGFDLESLLQLQWHATVDGIELSDDELAELVEAKRSVVRLRGRWVRVDQDRLAALRRRRTLSATDALAAALGAPLVVDGEAYEVEVTGPLGQLARRLRDLDPTRCLPAPVGLHATLRPYQERGLAWLHEMSALGLGGVLAETVRVRTFEQSEWDRLLDTVVARAAHTAALLDGELTPEVVAAANQAGVELLPGPGDLQPRCSCPDWADPCKHAAAVCYLMADRLDEDPFELLHARGRPRDVVLEELRRRRAGAGPSRGLGSLGASRFEQAADPGVPARDAWAGQRVADLPSVPTPRPRPGRPAPPVGSPEGVSTLSSAGLEVLAIDAARRAWHAVRDDPSGLELRLDHDTDLARRAAGALGTPAWPILAAQAGIPARALVERASAWRVAGRDGVRILQSTRWQPERTTMSAAREAISRYGRAVVRDNTVTVDGGVQVRLGHDRRWYRFDRRGRGWELTAGPADDPDTLITE